MKKTTKRVMSVLLTVLLLAGLTATVPAAEAAVTRTQAGVYYEKLRDIVMNPNRYLAYTSTEDIENYSTYAVADIDGDGSDELLVRLSNGIVVSQSLMVWKYNTDSTLTQLTSLRRIGFLCEFYKNGYAIGKPSHNQTPGDTIYPYSVYRFDIDSDTCTTVYSAYCADKNTTYLNQYHSYEDLDQDGVIYYINDEAMTKAEYDAVVNRYVPARNRLNVQWKKLTYANIQTVRQITVPTPQITSLTSDENGIAIRWQPVEGAYAYRVYYKNSEGEWRRFNGDIRGTARLDTGVKYGRAETYTVRAVDAYGNLISGYKASGWTTTYGVATPQITGLKSDEKGIHISWSKVSGASTYRVYYINSKGEWARFKSDIKGTTLLDTGVKYGRAETYTVRAVNKKGDVMSGYKSSGWTTTYSVATPVITSLRNTAKGIQISWQKLDGVSTYRVYYKNSKGEWARFKNDVKGTTLLDTGVKVGRQETYTVRAVDTRGNLISDYYHPGWSVIYQ
ncbi:MAG: hypothetical protein IJ598_03030 [Ruminococcus sp.]|nr:hypothetical protein [Ruminococcus sp.]